MDSPVRIDAESLLNQAPFVQRLAKALVRRADLADDVAQDVFVAALQQRSGETRHLRGWLAAVTKRLARRTRAAEQRRSAHETNAAPPAGDDRERHTAERLQLQRRLCDAVFALPEPYRTTVTLRFFDELTPRAIAARLAVPSDVVRQRLHRGLVMLRQQLDRDFGDRRAWIGAFAAAGLGFAGSPWLLLTVLTMNKLMLCAAATLVAGAFFFWPENDVEFSAVPAATAVPMTQPSNANATAAALASTDAPPPERTSGAAPASPECRVRVVDANGDPIADADVHCWSDGGDLIGRRTDHDGRCSFGDLQGPGHVLVQADGRFPRAETLAQRRGDHRIELPPGASISGRLLVDGAIPRHEWALALEPVELGVVLPDILGNRLRYGRGCAARIDAAGCFAWHGVPADWAGGIRLPQPLWRTDGGTDPDRRPIAVRAGQTDIVLQTTQLQTLHLRIVWQDDGSPVAAADVTAYGEFADGSNSPALSLEGDRDGRARIGFSPSNPSLYYRWVDPANRPPIAHAVVTARANGSDGAVKATLSREELASGEFHVLRLPRAAVTHFVAVTVDGSPIASARVAANGVSAPTGADGRGTFAGAAGDVRQVGAAGHYVGPCAPRAPAGGTADDPLVFVLPRSNAVRLRVLDERGAPPEFVKVQIHSDAPAFTSGAMPSELAKELGSPVQGGSANVVKLPDGSTTHSSCRNFVDKLDGGVAVMESLVPGQPCVFIVFDLMHRELARAAFSAPPAGEEITVDLVVPATVRELRGRVVDEAGNPVAKAGLRLAPPTEARGYAVRAATDDTGAFCLRGVYATEALRLTIDASGFVVQQHDLPPLRDEDPSEPTFQLERGLPVTVRVVDENDAPVPISPRLDETSRLHDAFDDVSAGVRRWRALPPQPVTFHCRIGGVVFSQRHDPRQPEAVLRVPKPGRLVITAPGGWPRQPETTSLVAKVQRLDATAPLWTIWSPEDGDEELLVPGRYRIELFASSRPPQGGEPVERALGLAAEVTLHAGSVTRAEVR